jgi:hypothetical protein
MGEDIYISEQEFSDYLLVSSSFGRSSRPQKISSCHPNSSSHAVTNASSCSGLAVRARALQSFVKPSVLHPSEPTPLWTKNGPSGSYFCLT